MATMTREARIRGEKLQREREREDEEHFVADTSARTANCCAQAAK